MKGSIIVIGGSEKDAAVQPTSHCSAPLAGGMLIIVLWLSFARINVLFLLLVPTIAAAVALPSFSTGKTHKCKY